MLRVTESGLYCDAGDFFIDPWRPVQRAVVTHAHSDHLTGGCGHYLVAERGVGVSRERLRQWQDRVEGIAFGEICTVSRGSHLVAVQQWARQGTAACGRTRSVNRADTRERHG